MATGFEAKDRSVLEVSGADAGRFLQDLVTNDIMREGLVYAALLTPQGKYLFDFFVWREADLWRIDVASERAEALLQRLSMYKLRADVTLAASDLRVFQIWGSDQGFADPRHDALGRRLYARQVPALDGGEDWDALRVAHLVPQSGAELLPDESYILECGFERLSGVDFSKGCYVGQEVTARMKHKTELRKGLARVRLSAPVAPGAVVSADGREIGRIHTVAGQEAIAYLRFDRAGGAMEAGGVRVTRV